MFCVVSKVSSKTKLCTGYERYEFLSQLSTDLQISDIARIMILLSLARHFDDIEELLRAGLLFSDKY